jgi:hypothetical protein
MRPEATNEMTFQNRMDLLTVQEHEIGHMLGFYHGEPGASATGDLKIDILAPGFRRMPGRTEVNGERRAARIT